MYIFLLFFLILNFFIKSNKGYIIMSNTLIFTLIWGLRYDVGIDYLGYEKNFRLAIDYGEVGYKVIENVARKISNDFYWVTLITSFLTIFLISLSWVKRGYSVTEIKISYFLYFISRIPFTYNNLIRQALATAILYFAIDYFIKKRWKIFIFLFFISFCFHKSVFLFIFFLILFYNIKLNRFYSILILCIFYIGSFFISITSLISEIANLITLIYPQYTFTKLLSYREISAGNSFNLGIFVEIIFFLLILINKKKNIDIGLFEKFYLIALILKILSKENFIINRLELYFSIYYIDTIINFIREKGYRKINKTYKKLLLFFIIIINLYWLIRTGYYSSDNSKNKYKTIFSTNNYD